MGLGVAEGSEAPGDCLPDCDHADIALGAGVGERGVGVAGEAAGPAVVDQDATGAGDDTQVVDGGATAPSVDERHPQAPGTDAVQPVVRAIDAQAGLVGVQGGRVLISA